MANKWTLLPASAGAVLLAATILHSADLYPVVVTGMSGTLRVQQGVPCDDDVDLTTPVIGGRLELTPSEGVSLAGGAKRFTLVRGNITFDGFSVSRSCLGFDRTRNYDDIFVQISKVVTFTASPTATPDVYSILIPKETFVLTYATVVNGDTETGTKQPVEDVTGTLNLAAGTLSMRVVLKTRVNFRAGCTPIGCVINETHDGTLTANLAGNLVYPDSDGDGVPDRTDNCKYTANPAQNTIATPTMTPPPNTTLNSCLSRNFGRAASFDVCDATAVTVTSDAPLQFNLGPNTVNWHAVDGKGRTADATQTVTIVDTTAPSFTFVPPDVFMNNCGPATLGQPAATDDCAGAVTFSNNAPPYFYVGVTPVTWTARDVSGNTTNAVQNVTVVDTVAPTVSCTATNPTGSSYVVSAFDACTGAPALRLGTYTLGIGETIMINEIGRPGIRLVGTVAGGIRHFQVGPGEAVITATDESSNSTSISCPVR